MATPTTNKGFQKPAVNGDIDIWGGVINGALDLLDGFFHLGGGLRVAHGGTGGTTAAEARTNLGAAAQADLTATATTANNAAATANAAMPKTGGAFSAPVAYAGRAAPAGEMDLGYRGLPRNLQQGAYTYAAADAGAMVAHFAGTAITHALPTVAGGAPPVGSVITLITTGAGSITISPAAGVTIDWAGTGLTGARKIGGGSTSVATLIHTDTNYWILTGGGVS